MSVDHSRGVPATAAIKGHPIHPMLIPYPIAFLSAVVLTDLVYWLRLESFWARFSWWLLLGGLIGGVVAALAGLVDFVTIERAREHKIGWIHLVGMALVLILALFNLVIRDPASGSGVLPLGIVISAITAIVLAISGWFGGELSYRHSIGVTGHDGD
ncbi:MAG: DUF2231 domain-containing protein [Thermoanaerobaculia bacterium]|nr:DUF2231 domain-containing protein [Thermoanaerobaculia bacterium]